MTRPLARRAGPFLAAIGAQRVVFNERQRSDGLLDVLTSENLGTVLRLERNEATTTR
jgi:hypothetical protein